MYHTNYLIEDTRPEHPTKRFYHGVHSSELHPSEDVYMGSSQDREFKSQMQRRPTDFIKYTLSFHKTRQDACDCEVSYPKRDVVGKTWRQLGFDYKSLTSG